MHATLPNQDLTERFGEWLIGQGRSALTTQAYRAELERLAAWAEPAQLPDLQPAHIRRYLSRGRRRGDSPATRNVRLAAIRKFWTWLVSAALVDRNAAAEIPVIRVARAEVEYLSRRSVRALLSALDGRPRDEAIFLVVLTTGVRVGELVPMDQHDVRRARGEISIAVKGDEPPRTVYPSQQAGDALDAYLVSRDDDEEALFVSRRRERLAARTIQGAFARHFRRAGVAGSLRAVRHTFAVHRTQSGMEAHHLQELMGYKTLQSAEIYQETVPHDVREVARQTEERY
jgi:site-specific recombinase XerD